MKKRFTLIFLISCLLFPAALFAQDIKVTGKVTDQTDGGPLPGVTVTIEGTSKATLTDNAGKFTISAPTGSKLVFRLIGMTSKTVTVTNEPINVTLGQDTKALSEVVVVGYGTQKRTVVSGAISGVKASDLENQPVNRVEQSLQGRTSGLTVASTSGSPGAASTVRLRGFTSFGGDNGKNNPLWVVDGVVVDNGGIGYLNQSDIESIDVLKDAASAAIYGARSAAGVILVTTKKGKEGNIRVTYSGYYGTAAPAKKLNLLNASQYAQVQNQATANSNADYLAANQPDKVVALPYANPAALGQGTDWQDLIFNNDARKQNHEVSISGGNEKSTFYTSFGYTTIDGIVATQISQWKRANIRLNSTHKLAKWLTFGENLGYSHSKTNGVGPVNREFGGPLSSAINLSPTIPAVITSFGGTDPTYVSDQSFYNSTPGALKNANGNYYGIPRNFQEMTNPLAYIQKSLGNFNYDHNIVGNAFLEATPIKGLKVRSSVGTKLAFYGNDTFNPISYLGATSSTARANFNRGINYSTAWNIENTATYTMAIDKNHFNYLIGQGFYKDGFTRGLSTTFNGIPATTFYEASMRYTPVAADITTSATEGTDHQVTSLFARAQYDYDEKYLFTALVRRDGSSRFGANHKYGYFPSFSVGWVPTREDFLKPNDVLTSLKIRGSYGITGNDQVGDFAYAAVISPGRNYPFGSGPGESLNIGYSPAAAANPDLKWEQTTQTDIGIDLILFQNLTFTTDIYKKKTTGILQTPPTPAYVGNDAPPANIGDMENTGIEFELGYRRKVGEFTFSGNANASFTKNKVTKLLPNVDFIEQNSATFQNLGNITRTQIGGSYNQFYGYKALGIFQSQAEVNAYKGSNGNLLQPNAKPGDEKFANLNGDNVIDANDRTYIGNPTPTMTYGLTLNVAYKNWDLTAFGSGVAGNTIFQGLKRLDIPTANSQTTVLNAWTPTNTGTNIPRVVTNDANGNYTKFSSLYLEKGNYFRLRTLQVGYTFPKEVISKLKIQRLRIYVLSENLFTLTKYSGYDPELGVSPDAGGGDAFSIDRGSYPQARTFLFGVNVGF